MSRVFISAISLILSHAAPPVVVTVDWAAPPSRSGVVTAATVEVDIMPQLARASGDPVFPGYLAALAAMGNAHVRFAPWYPYPRAAVLELEPANCSAGGRGTSFNSTVLDAVLADFMTAVCGPRAAVGECLGGRSVVPQLSTMPVWLFKPDGKDRTPPSDPWQYVEGDMEFYRTGQPLVDPTCAAMAQYAARYVAHYTAGGHTDECGVYHASGLHYNWPLLSVLNENEYKVVYTSCWDEWKKALAVVNPAMQLVGPEFATDPTMNSTSRDFVSMTSFLNASSHADGKSPDFVSVHVALIGSDRDNFTDFFDGLDTWVDGFLAPFDAVRASIAPKAQIIVNEFIPFLGGYSWCTIPPNAPPGTACPWDSNHSHAVRMAQTTLGWAAAAASFAHAFGRFSELGLFIAGADQLIGGPFPNNEPAVASLDWDTGKPNAKFWAVQMLAQGVGTAPRDLYPTVVSGAPPPPVYGLGMQFADGRRVVLVVSKSMLPCDVVVAGAGENTTAVVLDAAGDTPGFTPPSTHAVGAAGQIALGPFGIALVTL